MKSILGKNSTILQYTHIAILSIILFGVYSRYKIIISGYVIPFAISVIGVIAGALVVRKYDKRVVTSSVMFLLSIGVFAYISNNLSSALSIEALKTYTQLFFSIYAMAVTYEILRCTRVRLLENTIITIVVLMLILSVLDIFTQFHVINIYLKENLGGVIHDPPKLKSVSGQIRRPLPFTLEPSYTAGLIFVLLPLWYFHSRRTIIFYVLVAVSIIVVRSPILLPVIIIGIMIDYYKGSFKSNVVYWLKTSMLVGTAFFLSWFALGERVAEILYMKDLSAYARLVEPLYYTILSFIENPIVGPGLGEYTEIDKLMVSRMEGIGGAHYGYLFTQPLTQMGIAGFFSYFVYLLYIVYVISNNKYRSLIFTHYIVMSLFMSAFVAPVHWVYLIFIIHFYSSSRYD